MNLRNNNFNQFINFINICNENKVPFYPSNYNLDDTLIDYYKGGSKIRIKKENKGKFTQSAKRAGMSIQEFARHVLNNKDKYSTTQIKRANFARNASKWNHKK